MSSISEALGYMTEHGLRGNFLGPFSEEALEAAERLLGLSLPPSYREFLVRCGAGVIEGDEYLGLAPTADGYGTVWYTLAARRNGLPPQLIVIQDRRNGTFYCLDTSQIGADGEAPVVEWVVGLPPSRQDRRPLAPSFADFVLLRLRRLKYRLTAGRDRAFPAP